MFRIKLLIRLVLVFACVGSIFIFSVTKAATAVKHPPVKPKPTVEKPGYGGTLKIIMPMSVVNLGCPWEKALPTDSHFRQPVMETLTRCDEKGLPVPLLAT